MIKKKKFSKQKFIADFAKNTDGDEKLKDLNKKLIQIKQNMYCFKMNQTRYQKKSKQYQQKIIIFFLGRM